jgi:sortase A
VVQPQDTYVLNPTPQPALTLITCYPFTYIGAAPERFVVRAVLAPNTPVNESRVRD